MLSQMNQASRAIVLLAKNNHGAQKINQRFVKISGIHGSRDSVVLTNSRALSDSPTTTQKTVSSRVMKNAPSNIEDRVPIILMKKNFDKPEGLKYSENRDNLVVDFFKLSKSVMDGRIGVEEFLDSQTFKKLQKAIEMHIDFLSNAQLINLLASVIKMRINPSTNLVKLLEHEVKFRLKLFNMNQIVKILRFYNSTEMSSDQKQLAEMLSYRVRAYIQSASVTIKELNSILLLISAHQAPKSWLSSIEEKMLDILSQEDEDDMVSNYLKKPELDYGSLCEIFIRFAAIGRRPTPLLKAASIELYKSPLLDSEKKKTVDPVTLISTLNALVNLNYTHPGLISKLISDLTEIIKLDELDSSLKCNLLRSIGQLKWRPEQLLLKFMDHISNFSTPDPKMDHHVVVAFLHVAASINYQPGDKIKQVYNQCMKGDRELLLDQQSRKWLDYVWSLAALKIAEVSHIESVLSDDFCRGLENSSNSPRIAPPDMMKLLNLQAIADLELKLKRRVNGVLDDLSHHTIQRGEKTQKFSSKVREAMNSVVNCPEDIRHEIQTPFGFIIDSEILLDDKLTPISLKGQRAFEEIVSSVRSSDSVPAGPNNCKRCALIYVTYADTISNNQNEVVGHKKMISRILKTIGYETVFLSQTLIDREKTSADVVNRIKTLITDSLTCNFQHKDS